jgi:hypothetical protein
MIFSKTLRQVVAGALTTVTTLSTVAVVPQTASAQSQVQRPPQFVLMAFDGSQSYSMWNATRDFARAQTQSGKLTKFTYFISCVYYITKTKGRELYTAARHANSSAIGWGSDAADVAGRIDLTSGAKDEGHEIASHACGHWDAGADNWTQGEWETEFKFFNQFVFDAYRINGLPASKKYATGYSFTPNDIVGFRAPQLGVTPGLWPTINKFGMRYDTSKTASPTYWPEKIDGRWNFPLANLVIAGSGKKTLSMDYNFYYADSKGEPDPDHAAVYEEQMVQTYLKYFENNYNGNRAPVHIGHHFSLWNGGAYWKAMQRFASKVCGLPEVKCVTYKELADYMDKVDATTLAAYKRGDFAKLQPVRLADANFNPATVVASNTPTGVETMANETMNSLTAPTIPGMDLNDWSRLVDLAKRGATSSRDVRAINKEAREILRRSLEIEEPIEAEMQGIKQTDMEDRVNQGDQPEAHLDEFLVDLGIPH